MSPPTPPRAPLRLVVATLALAAALARAGAAATIAVNSASTAVSPTDGLCTLREAIVAANLDAPSGGVAGECPAGSGADTIELAAGATYTLTAADNFLYGPNALPPVTSAITIAGHGASIARTSSGTPPAFRLLYVAWNQNGLAAGDLTLTDLTLTNGLARGGASGYGGGGAGLGGAIFNHGTLKLTGVTIANCTAQGGAATSGSGVKGGGGLGANGGATAGGGFGGGAAGATGGAGGTTSGVGGAGGGGFRSSDPGAAGGGSGGAGGGGALLGGAGGGASGSSAGAAGDGGGGGGGVAAPGGAGGAFGAGGSGGAMGAGGGGGGVGGGGGSSGGVGAGGGGGGFGGGGGYGDTSLGGTGGKGGFGGGGAAGTGAGTGGFGGGNGGGSLSSAGGGGAGLGGAIFNHTGSVTIENSTLSGNTAKGGNAGTNGQGGTGFGGGVFNLDGALVLRHATIAGNTVQAGTGGAPTAADARAVYSLAYGKDLVTAGAVSASLELANSILSDATATLNDVVVAHPTGGPNHPSNASTANASGPNLVRAVSIAPADFSGTAFTAGDPLLAALAANGGPTMTRAIGGASPALNAGAASAATTDQRGRARAVAAPDLGAFELQRAIAATSGTPQSAGLGAPFANPLVATVSDEFGSPVAALVAGVAVTFTPPGAGASAALAPANPVLTDGAGVASVDATANATAGSYAVTADVAPAAATPASFALTNLGPTTDLGVTLSDGGAFPHWGDPIVYTLVAAHVAGAAATGATVTDDLPASLTAVTWSCAPAGGALCTANGAGDLADTVNLPVGGSVTYTIQATVVAGTLGAIADTATVAAPAGLGDTNPANDSASTSTPVADLFRDGFEGGTLCAWNVQSPPAGCP